MPASTLLSALCSAAVLERTPARQGTYLRVTPRFLAHAEQTDSLLRHQGQRSTATVALASALTSWDEFHHDPNTAAVLLADLLEERGQLGMLRPVFPMLEQFAQIAA